MFIRVNEKYYHNGGYQKRPLLLNVNEISSVGEDTSGYEDFTMITMNNGKIFGVAEPHGEVEKMIASAFRGGDR